MHSQRTTPLVVCLAIALLTLTPPMAHARRGHAPHSLTPNGLPLDGVEQLTLATPDVTQLIAEDEARAADGFRPYRYAVPRTVDVRPSTHGTWHDLDGGDRLWRMRIDGEGATDLNLGFTRFRMPQGAALHVWSETDDYYEGPYTYLDNEVHGELWVPVVPGARAVAELYVPVDAAFEPELHLTQVGYGYKNIFGHTQNVQGSCNNDVICPEGDPWRDDIASAAAFSLGGGLLCSGQMIMDVPASFRNFFLTASHCGVNAGNAASMVVYWNFESPSCGDLCCGSLADNQSGAVFRARRSDADFCLVELDDIPDPESNVYWAGWDRSGVAANGSVSIHHPSGDEKAISFNFDPLTTMNSCIGGGASTHWRVNNWEDGTTEPGSSGGGLWDIDTHLLVGVLSGGLASCSNINYDCYGKFSLAWDGSSPAARLRDWLDPGGQAPLSVAGSFPDGIGILFYIAHSGNDQCTENPDNVNGIWEPGETIELVVDLQAAGGSLTGVNGVLSTSTPGITIVDAQASWPDIDSGTSASTNAPHFTVQISPAFECDNDIDFDLSITANEAGPFLASFSDIVGLPAATPEVPISIPDNNFIGGFSPMTITDSFTLTDVDVQVDVEHTRVGDLQILLISPDNTTVTLLDRPGVPATPTGCADDDVDIVFDDDSGFDPENHCEGTTPWYSGSAAPASPLAALNGKSIQGTWNLRVVDRAAGSQGEIVNWRLITTPPLLGTCEVCNETTAIELGASPSTAAFGLDQNRPNPFNPHTTITFDLDTEGATTLEIFDVAGRLVKTLVDESMAAGSHAIRWDGTDSQQRPVATGVYFYRLERDGDVEVRRMSVIR